MRPCVLVSVRPSRSCPRKFSETAGTIPGDRSMRIASVYESKSSINCIKPFYPINIAKLPPRILGYGIVPEDTSFHLFQLLCC